MRVADYIADFLYRQGVKHVFMVTGGGMMFLSDGVAAHPELQAVHTHHEQAAAMAAVGYAKYSQSLGACYVTTGCGGTNALTGLLNCWQDNIPCFFISGQSKRKETVRNSGLPIRQIGVQEADIIPLVESLTKYAVMINKPEMVPYHLEKALSLAVSGRPGPVWLDIPLDVQGAPLDLASLPHYDQSAASLKPDPSEAELASLTALLAGAKRPVCIAGQGVRLAKAIPDFKNFVERFNLPFVVSKLGVDLLPVDHPLYIGRIGNKGDRAGNLAVQNSDLVISVGCRLSVSSTGHEYHLFAREARIVVVDIDPIEHKKNTVRIDQFIHADAQRFLSGMNARPVARNDASSWLERCAHWRDAYPVWQPEYTDTSKGINLYHFTHCLSQAFTGKDVVVTDAGSAFYVVTQAIRLKEGMRLVTSGGQAEMGYALPAAIGVSYAEDRGRIAAVTGDGSFQMNIQELQTIAHNRLPVKIFVLNNDGYLSIRASQRKFFDGRFIGADSTSGLSFPDLEKIAAAYGLPFVRLAQTDDLVGDIAKVLNAEGPVLCEVMCPRDQEIIPTSSAMRREDGSMVSKPLEDMYPFLDRETFRREMIVTPVAE